MYWHTMPSSTFNLETGAVVIEVKKKADGGIYSKRMDNWERQRNEDFLIFNIIKKFMENLNGQNL